VEPFLCIFNSNNFQFPTPINGFTSDPRVFKVYHNFYICMISVFCW